MKVRDELAKIARASSDTAATHALLIWLDSLPPEVMITAEGKRRAGIGGEVTSCIPKYRPGPDSGSTIEMQVESDAKLARVYWEHPAMMWSARRLPGGE